jgi:hypothetical protein
MNFEVAQKYKEMPVWSRARSSWIGIRDLCRNCRSCGREFSAWARCRQARFPDVKTLAESIAALPTGALDAIDGARDTEAPIFLLSTGWRTGSTLLQRVLVTDPRLLLWGEPLGGMALLSRMTEMVNYSLSQTDLELWKNQDKALPSSLPTSWIATLTPPSDDFRLALRSLFERWLAEPARQRGFSRWGLKEVRLGATEAYLLHWLFPNAKFLVISRNPYDSYRSLADSTWEGVYYRHPDVFVDSAAGFARHWSRLAVSWSDLPAGFPFFHIRYEDLVGGKIDFREVEDWLGIEIKENLALSVSVGGTAVRSRLSWYERLIITREAAAGMRALGYRANL